MAPDDLVALLEQSRAKNAALGVTGLLLHREGTSMQVLVGEEDVVRPPRRPTNLDLLRRRLAAADFLASFAPVA